MFKIVKRCAAVSVMVAFVLLIILSVVGTAMASGGKDLSEFQKETIKSIRDITLQLILIAMGVFTIIGGFATSAGGVFKYRSLLWIRPMDNRCPHTIIRGRFARMINNSRRHFDRYHGAELSARALLRRLIPALHGHMA